MVCQLFSIVCVLTSFDQRLTNHGYFSFRFQFAQLIVSACFNADWIAKTMAFIQDDKIVLILTEGTARVDNRKYRDRFHVKAKMVPFDSVEELVGHAPGGVCPFGINPGIDVYLDESLKRYERVFPAAGNDHSAVNLTISELEDASGAAGWVDVCKEPEK